MQSSAGILALGQLFYCSSIIVMRDNCIAGQVIFYRSIKADNMAD
jgi:hypothetical protein